MVTVIRFLNALIFPFIMFDQPLPEDIVFQSFHLIDSTRMVEPNPELRSLIQNIGEENIKNAIDNLLSDENPVLASDSIVGQIPERIIVGNSKETGAKERVDYFLNVAACGLYFRNLQYFDKFPWEANFQGLRLAGFDPYHGTATYDRNMGNTIKQAINGNYQTMFSKECIGGAPVSFMLGFRMKGSKSVPRPDPIESFQNAAERAGFRNRYTCGALFYSAKLT